MAPEKINISPAGVVYQGERQSEYDIEYIRTDAFIGKALKWYCLDCECNDNCNALHNCFFKSEFKRYLEGADNALPPKFKNALNPDGSTSDNYRHRHFIGVMKDKFIEKACKWFNNSSISDYLSGEMIEDFKRFIKSDE